MFSKKVKTNGFSLVEVLVGASVILVAIFTLMNSYAVFIKASAGSSKTVEATYLLEEGIEAMRFIRDTGWANLVAVGTSSSKYLVFVASSTQPYYVWQTTSTKSLIDGVFLRTIKIDDVKRDLSTQNISSTGAYDANTKMVTVTVAWPYKNATTTKTISTYLTNIYGN